MPPPNQDLNEGPTEPINADTEHVPHTIQPGDESDPDPESTQPISEVRLLHENIDVSPNNYVEQGDQEIDGEAGRSPRSNKGIPLNRYSPERIGRHARYSVGSIARANLIEMARAFSEALYEEEEIPHTLEQAMKSKHWRKTMKVEMDALARNRTWAEMPTPRRNETSGMQMGVYHKEKAGWNN